ncbi:hypothetical protein C5167_049148 [Papaver somniferum]|uniref:Uncharacterized protein n=1 Tax=Papaver somniferum TaxID=3469 RepID=A0A4Y7KK04_PAPSO|nr:hypothetical protein C5167_049148 [Papaver somniferum]
MEDEFQWDSLRNFDILLALLYLLTISVSCLNSSNHSSSSCNHSASNDGGTKCTRNVMMDGLSRLGLA